MKAGGPTFQDFLNEFSSFLEDIAIVKKNLIILGDFNIHIDESKSIHTQNFLNMITTFGLIQHVQQATHSGGHILDLILTRDSESVNNLTTDDALLSDHFALSFTLSTNKPPLPKREITYRNFKSIDVESFNKDIASSPLVSCESTDPNYLADTYNNVLTELLNKHAPQKKKSITVHPSAPWYNDLVIEANHDRRQAERKWRKTGLQVHREIFCEARDKVKFLISKSKKEYYKDKISSSCDSQKALFSAVKELLGNKSSGKIFWNRITT